MSRLCIHDVTIPNGTALSNETDLRDHRIVAVEMPAAWTAAGIGFQSCARSDGASNPVSLTETFLVVKDSGGTEVTLTAAASIYVVLTEAHRQALAGLGRVKVVSGTAGVPVNQAAARTLRLVTEPRDANT